MTYANEIAIFAARFSVSPHDAVVLPALFQRAAKSVKMPLGVFIDTATYRNNELGEYIAKCASDIRSRVEL